jgi:hypothetical protein
MTDHVGTLLQVLLQRLRLRGEVGHHAGLEDAREDLNLLRCCRYARNFPLKIRYAPKFSPKKFDMLLNSPLKNSICS